MAEDTLGLGLLSDIEILERLVTANDDRLLFVSPLANPKKQVGPSSLDVHLGGGFIVGRVSASTHLNLGMGEEDALETEIKKAGTRYNISPGGSFVLHPGEFALGSTLEYFQFPNDLAGRIEGRSSIGRLGLQVHATAGFVDPGFEGVVTFELINVGNLPIQMKPGLRLAQMCFFHVPNVQVPYPDKPDSKYSHSVGPDSSRLHIDTQANSKRSETTNSRDE
jgi:dCTP deaminase